VFYLELFRCLGKREVRYLVVGGLAMNLYGVPRLTMDVDLVLALDEANLDRFLACAAELGLRPQAPVSPASFKDPEQRRQWREEKGMISLAWLPASPEAPTVDVLIAHCLDFDQAYRRSQSRQAGGVQIHLAAVDDLIAMKQLAGRQQDQADIEHLRRIDHER
jgi:hypothetical protein